ncbi:cytochrome ubiquinol oxidase subunit I [Desulfomicrobium orale]|uniref:cytochrome ubiquinol oxidase subunit I n=1 Tax=Desulfomicrobium orale TaxID=132132 RepID=UPI0009F8700A|nr:cytochrome ubiquinol oxidase subunit I [Desulfomicrobium orale]
MNFPVWELHWAGGGLLIAAMAVFHVYIAHFAVGGGLFLVLTERMGYRRNSPGILEYTRRHTKFFLLVTMVLGGITGVGIWFTISLLSPAATAQLIHTFVFAWAIEWVFFLGEIVALFVYFYTFGKIRPQTHMTAGWLYFFFGWMSLFMINGIIGFMLTPGDWLSTRDFWDGFFNPSFWPALVFRTCLVFMLAGLYGFVTAAWEKGTALREAMVRHCALWLLAPFAILLLSGWWYVNALPEAQEAMVLGANPEIAPFLRGFILISAALFAGGLVMAARMPALAKHSVAVTLLVIGLMYMVCFEWTREAGRRPYLIHSYMYSNGVLAGSEKAVSATGYLKTSGWNRHQTVTAENMVDAGREIFRGQCSSCHSIGGPMKDIRKYTAGIGVMGFEALISGMGKVYEYMPVFVGTRQERTARHLSGPGNQRPDRNLRRETPGPARNTSGRSGVRSRGGRLCSPRLERSGPENHLRLRRDVVLTFSAPAGFEHPSRQVEFWKHARSLTGKDLPPDTGLTGRRMSGTMTLDGQRTFTAEDIPVLPYGEGLPNPYPVFTIEARSQDGELLGWPCPCPRNWAVKTVTAVRGAGTA